MQILMAVALSMLQLKGADTFPIRAELQGIYDEISQAMLQVSTDTDIDDFHSVFYTPDWTLIDASGTVHSWDQVRGEMIQALQVPALDSIQQSIQEITATPTGVTTLVDVTTLRTIVDVDGRYGRKGAMHTQTETTRFRDTWVKPDYGWKCQRREQTGPSTTLVSKDIQGT